VQAHRTELIAFAQKLVQTPSMPGEEGQVAHLIQQKMQTLGYDEVSTDAYGTVIGRLKGGSGPSLMLNSHMDHVDPGDPSGWPHPPFSGHLVDGHLWGRASVDMKGPLACMVYTPAILKSLNIAPPGDLYVTTAVMEEVGGIGTSYLAQHLHSDCAIVGEPSKNTLRLGHRGRVEIQIVITGKAIHASIPQAGLNPHYILADFLRVLPNLPMVSHPRFGSSTFAPTLLHSDQNSANVTPGQLTLTLDWRNIPSESPDAILAKLNSLLQTCLPPQASGEARLASHHFTTYTGQAVKQ
jgi:putative selenium metabolism hydrolase